MRRIPTIAIVPILCALLLPSRTMHAQVRLTDASDAAALRAWFVLLADAQFYRATSDVTDCAALVRHALREALRPHTPEWRRTMALPGAPVYADVRVKTPLNEAGGLAMFRVSDSTGAAAFQEFADAEDDRQIEHTLRRTRRRGAAAWRSDLLPSAFTERSRSSDGLRRLVVIRVRGPRLGGVSHRA